MEMTHERWTRTNEYAREVFGTEPEHIEAIRLAADAAGLPSWAVTPEVGALLRLLASTTEGRRALEIGTLGGYSTLWILEGMDPDGEMITIEFDPGHADFCEEQFDALGVADRISLRRGAALDVLPGIVDESGPASLDLVFIDADKEPYPDYYRLTRDLVRPGGLLVVDNVFGTGSSWIDDLSDPGMAAVDEMNRLAAADEDFVTAGIFMRAGLLVARRR